MTDPSPTSASTPTASTPQNGLGRVVLPLWIAALSLAAIAVAMIICSVELIHAVHATQASVTQLQREVSQLRSGLGGILGG